MSAFNVVLTPSRYARLGLLLLALLPVLVLATHPLEGGWRYALLMLSFGYYWQCYSQFSQLEQSTIFTLTAQGRLQSANASLPSGQLIAGGLVSQYVLKLCWRCDDGDVVHQRWIFADQCTDTEYRALARLVNQTHWQPRQANV